MTRMTNISSFATIALLAQSARAAVQCTQSYGGELGVQYGTDYRHPTLATSGPDGTWLLNNAAGGNLKMSLCTSDYMNITQSQVGSVSYIKLSIAGANTELDETSQCLTAQYTDSDTATFKLEACSFEDDKSQEGQFFSHLQSGKQSTFKDIIKLIGPQIRAHNPDSEGPSYNFYGEGTDKVLTARYEDVYKNSLTLEEL